MAKVQTVTLPRAGAPVKKGPPPPAKKAATTAPVKKGPPPPAVKKGPPPEPALTLGAGQSSTAKFAMIARTQLKRVVISEPEREFFSTGNKLTDSIFGVPGKGLFSGGMVELRGDSSAGKSLIGADLAALCKERGAIIHWVDVEASWTDKWMAARGLAREEVNLYQPFLGLFMDTEDKFQSRADDKRAKKADILRMLQDPDNASKAMDKTRMESAEEVIEDLERALKLAHMEYPDKFQFIVLDSVAALMTDEEITTDLSDHNARTKQTLGWLTGQVFKRWMGFLPAMRAYALLLNQTRINPRARPGTDPTYSPGARPMTYYPQIRIELHRKSGFLTRNGVSVGIHGKLKVFKNKADGVEGRVVAYKCPYKGRGYLEEIS